MASVTIITGAVVTRRAALVRSDGLRWEFPHAPESIDNSGLSAVYGQVDRPDREPLTVKRGERQHKMSWAWTLGRPFGDVEGDLHQLRQICRTDTLVRLDWGPSEGGWWLVTSCGWESTQRDETGAITRAEVSLELTRAVDPVIGALVGLVPVIA